MDTAPLPNRVIRVDSRHRRPPRDLVTREPAPVLAEEEGEPATHIGETPPDRGQRQRAMTGKAHSLFHRREAQDRADALTANVEIIASLDPAGKVATQYTKTVGLVATPAVPLPATVAAIVLPSVPAVPPFPSDLLPPPVPSFPWPSGVPTLVATEAAAQPASPVTAEPTATGPTSARAPLSVSNSGLTVPSPSTALSSPTSSPSSPLSSSSISSSPTPSQNTASSTVDLVGPTNPGTPAPSSPNSPSNGSLHTPAVVGTVIGSLAAFVLLLLVILFLIKRHKKKQRGGALQLIGDDPNHTDEIMTQPIIQNPARGSFIAPSFLNRFSGISRSTADSSGTGEKSFQRISGRKLPSAFSEGMTSEQFAAGRGEGTLSGTSFYHDDQGLHSSPGVLSKDFGEGSFAKEIGGTASATEPRVRPGPAQTPIIRRTNEDAPQWGTPRNGGNASSPPHTPNATLPAPGSLGRTHASRDGSTISRNSRFTENV